MLSASTLCPRLQRSGLPGAIPASRLLCGHAHLTTATLGCHPRHGGYAEPLTGAPHPLGPPGKLVSSRFRDVAEETCQASSASPPDPGTWGLRPPYLYRAAPHLRLGYCRPLSSRSFKEHWAVYQDNFGHPCRMWRAPQIRRLPQAA